MGSESARSSGRGSPRRAPKPEDRGRAAEQTRERILRAAVAEFGAKGYAGARTAGIAERAGVNQQLIAYYFGGKQGLLDELRRRWAAQEATLDPADTSFAASFAAYLDATLDQPDWARLMAWQALGDSPGDGTDPVEVQRARLRPALDRTRQRQRAGELTSAVDAEFIVLLTHAVAFAPIVMPHIVTAIFELDPHSPEYRRRCVDQLLTLLGCESHEGSVA